MKKEQTVVTLKPPDVNYHYSKQKEEEEKRKREEEARAVEKTAELAREIQEV